VKTRNSDRKPNAASAGHRRKSGRRAPRRSEPRHHAYWTCPHRYEIV